MTMDGALGLSVGKEEESFWCWSKTLAFRACLASDKSLRVSSNEESSADTLRVVDMTVNVAFFSWPFGSGSKAGSLRVSGSFLRVSATVVSGVLESTSG